MEIWLTTTDTRLATAFGTLGFPVKLRTTLIDRTGLRETVFSLASISACGRYKSREILGKFRKGILETESPGHPFLCVLRAISNRGKLLDFQNKGRRCQIVKVPGAPVWQYVPGTEGLPGIAGHTEIIATEDLKAVAALGLVGVRLLAIEGGGHSHRYLLARHGLRAGDGYPPADGQELIAAWRKDKASVIPLNGYFAEAAYGLYNRERFLDAVNHDRELLLLEKPRTTRSAIVQIDAAPAAFDQVKRHFDAI